MVDVVQIALRNIFEPMTQNERLAHIRFLRTHFESTPTEGETTPSVGGKTHSSKSAPKTSRRGGLPFYIKAIEGIDETKSGGYCIVGPFVQPSKLGELLYSSQILIGTKSSPKKYCLAKVNPTEGLTFSDADGREITVSGAEMVSIHTDVKELISALKRFAPLKS
jgi:hypothetical protein